MRSRTDLSTFHFYPSPHTIIPRLYFTSPGVSIIFHSILCLVHPSILHLLHSLSSSIVHLICSLPLTSYTFSYHPTSLHTPSIIHLTHLLIHPSPRTLPPHPTFTSLPPRIQQGNMWRMKANSFTSYFSIGSSKVTLYGHVHISYLFRCLEHRFR